MPKLTTAEDDLLKRLTSKNVLTLGKKVMGEVANFIYRLMNVADEATKEHETTKILLKEAKFESACVVLSAMGMKTREEIEQKASMSDAMRERCLALRQMYDDATAYRALSITAEPATDYEAAR